MGLTPQQIEYVLTVAEERSFSKAAKKLFVTQPSLSKFIINLEASLGVTLFDRSSSPITVTEAGRIFMETANRMKELEEDMTLKMNDLAGLKNGTLKLGTTPFYAANMLLKTVLQFHSKYPDIQITICEDTYPNLEEEILKGELDLMIGSVATDEELFNIEELCTEKLYLAVPRLCDINKKCTAFALESEDIRTNSEKLFTGEYVDLALFRNENFIVRSSRETGYNVLKKICKKSGFNPYTVLESNNLDTIFSFVRSNLGVALIPDTFIKFSDVTDHPVYYAIDSPEIEKYIKLVYKKNKYLSRSAIEFGNTLRELIGLGTWK
ncbi:MAG: LysR family transcriptional regulator [Oscillospiraceae bacterium]|nr:LysR family transcriptional regulator [Oscillospiraceae bacterium]